MLRIDMHFHSTFSDGICEVESLVQQAKKRKVSILSLTDHDTVDGVKRFLQICREQSIGGISGIELSADNAAYPLHILGYRFDLEQRDFKKALDNIRVERNERNNHICEKLNRLGIPITIEELQHQSAGAVITRPHFARYLVQKGYASCLKNAFDRYLGDGQVAYAARKNPSTAECIALIRTAGGLPVLAHPFLTRLPEEDFVTLLKRLLDEGLWGMECLTSHHSSEQAYYYLQLAGQLGLYATAGSDYHGGRRGGLGVVVEDSFLPWARLGIHF